MTVRTLTNSANPFSFPNAVAGDVALRLTLVDAVTHEAVAALVQGAAPMGAVQVLVEEMVAGVFSITLETTTATDPATEYLVEMWQRGLDDGQRFYWRFFAPLPDGAGELQWADFYDPGALVSVSGGQPPAAGTLLQTPIEDLRQGVELSTVRRELTNALTPFVYPDGVAGDVDLVITLLGPDIKQAVPALGPDGAPVGALRIAAADMVDGVFSVLLQTTDTTLPQTHYRVDMWQAGVEHGQGFHYQFVADLPTGSGAMQWQDFYAPGDEPAPEEWSAFLAHSADEGRHVLANQRASLDAANALSASNPVASMADVVGAALPTGQAEQDLLAGQPLRLLATGHLDLASATVAAHGEVSGLCAADTLAGNGAPYSRKQVTRSDWSAIVGAAALAVGAVYYLAPSAPGTLTTTAPDQVGQYLVRVGVAVSETTLQAAIEPPVKL